jgi:VanZ family protein
MKPFQIARMALTLGACAALLIAIVVLSLVPAHDRPVTALPHSLEHLTIFFAAGLAFGIGYPQRHRFQFPALLVFTAVIEMAQLVVPGDARLTDFVVDAVGIITGLSLGLIASPKLLSRPLPPGE